MTEERNQIEDLWPEDLLAEIPSSPQDILKQQAALLGPKTNNIILADVALRTKSGRFYLDFFLRVPVLENYRFDLFSVSYDISMYPVQNSNSTSERMKDEAELRAFVERHLKSEKTIRVIRTLIAQVRNSQQPELVGT